MNAEKLHKLQAQVRIGGKGSARRKKKVVHRTATADDKKLQSSLKKLAVNNIPGIEEGVHRSHDLGGTLQLAPSNAGLNSSIGSIDDVVLRCQKTYDPQISISVWLSHAKVNMIKDDGSVIHFNNPKVQASLAANTFAITGHAEQKQITEMLPGILNQLGAESLTHLKRIANVQNTMGTATEQATTGAEEDDEDEDVPDLVENFDEPSKAEGV